MFCRKCGAEMSENARFCPKCGNARMGEQPEKTRTIVEDNNVKYILKPKFNLLYKTITSIITGLFILLMIACCMESFELYIFFPMIPIVFLATYTILKLIFGKLQYNKMEYNFYATKIEYIDGFLNKEEKELKYKYIREISKSQGILERICNIGTIRIYTNATSGNASGSHSSMRGTNGIYIHCVENVDEQYRIIKQIIDEGTPED